MLHSLSRWFSRGAASAALLSAACSGVASAQLRHYVAPDRGLSTSARLQARSASTLKTPADMLLTPFLKAHVSKSSSLTNGALQTMGTPYATTPSFGGYVNAPMFSARTSASLATGTFNNGVTVELGADFDKDGKTDIAVFQQDGTLNILMNDGKGGLSTPVSYLNPNYQSGSINTAYAVDVNNDGYPDIVAYDYNNNTTITWINLKNGTFNAAVTTALDTAHGYPNMVYMADVNGDGKADLIFATIALAGRTSATVSLETQLGAGDGTFGTPDAAKVESFSFAASGIMPTQDGIAVADINGDGKMDIAISIDERLSQSVGTYTVATALGNGDGTFTGLGTTLPIAISAVSVGNSGAVAYDSSILSFADVNGDGKLDVVADVNGTLQSALGNGNGTFGTAVSTDISAIISADDTVLLDVNGDGKLDAIVDGGTLGVYLGNGDGTFAPIASGSQYVTDPSSGSQAMAIADFDNDGVPDIALLGGDYKQVSLFSNTGKGGFRGAPIVTAENDPNGLYSTLLTSGAYTSSGYSSPLLTYYGDTSTDLVTMVGDGKGNFTSVKALPAFPANVEYFQPIHADFNGDGLEDIVYSDTTGGVWVALSKGDGTFATPVSAGLPTSACPVYYGAAGDVNGDGKIDLVIPYGGDIACGNSGGGASGYFVALGNGDGTFSAPTFTATGTELYKIVLGDINNDGKLDIVIDDVPFIYGSGFEVSTALGNGDGTFGTPSIIVQNYLVADVAVSDINNDGNPDLVMSAEEVTGTSVSTGGILTVTGNGDNTFNSSNMIGMGNFFYGIQVADMNNDGNQDIVATLYSTVAQPVNYYGMVTLLGYGNGQFTAPYNSLESLGSENPIVGNFVNDAALDVITANGYGPALFIGQGSSALTLTTSASSIPFGTAETLTAALTSSMTGRPAATGAVSFYDGTTLLGTGTLSSTGTATLTVTTLATGTHAVKAVYAGDTNFNPATSTTSSVNVTAVTAAFTLTGTPATVSVKGGAQGVVTLNLAANASFSGAVTLTCAGMPTNGTCSINPGSVTLTAGGSSTATLVIGTTGTHAALQQRSTPWEAPAAGLSLASLLAVFFGRRKRVRMIAALGLGLVLSMGVMLTGCSDNGSNSSTSSAPTVTAGTYTVTVTATATGSTATAQTTTVSVTVN
ncbi:MAG: FG-GAP-like repeat-containing protein [Acidobacteriaceae bacterium]|nr:FG-GAP-like repeat-containing protein [Acidobacteriaceae bacterium]